MNIIFYIIAIVGAVMVYGSKIILKQFKLENDAKSIIILKLVGLGVALIGLLKLINAY